MENKFKYSNDNKRYHTLNYHLKNLFNEKVYKISLNGNFQCPNLDGTIGTGGCIYCSKLGSGEFSGNAKDSIKVQFEKQKKMMQKKWPNGKYIAYFGTRTSTYAPIKELKEKYEEALNNKDVVGLSIATRSDSITNETLNYLEEINKRTYLTIELGLQSINEKTINLINRCHTLENFENMVKKLNERNIKVIVHIINGLPNETKEMMINTVKYLSKLKIYGIKIHMLYIVKDTSLYEYYKKNKFHILTKDEYIDITTTQLRYIKKEVVINRITGDPKKEDLIEPKWLLKKFVLLNDIDKKMKKENIYQGDLI